jgi:hypothetical protein
MISGAQLRLVLIHHNNYWKVGDANVDLILVSMAFVRRKSFVE